MQIKKGQHLSATTEFKKGQNTGENNFNWKGGLVKTNCKFCNKEFYIKPSRIKIGIGKFCSKSCNAKSRTGKNGANWQERKIKRTCEICGKEFWANIYMIEKGYSRFCSRTCGYKGKKLYFGKDHPNWLGGITPLNFTIRNSLEYKQWRSDVFQRDNWTCQTCGIHSGEGKRVYLEAHHIKHFAQIIKDNNVRDIIEAQLCNELWDIDNGVTLCKDCHLLTRKKNSE